MTKRIFCILSTLVVCPPLATRGFTPRSIQRTIQRLESASRVSQTSSWRPEPSAEYRIPPSLRLAPANGAIDEATLWGIRLTSALVSYLGIVVFLDRPRGQMALELDRDIEIRPSAVPNAGLGLFAKTNLSKGTVLGTYPGVLVKITEANLVKIKKFPQCETYIWRFSDSKFVLDPTNEVGEIETTCRGGSLSLPGSAFLFSNLFSFEVPTTLCRINEPPLGKDVNVVTEEDLERRKVMFMLERDVYEGEEFFIDYGLTYDRSMYGGGETNPSSLKDS